MKEILYRQPVFNRDGSFSHFHYWGWISEGNFVAPLSMAHDCKDEKGQQFVGLKDRNGVKIFEGDIVSWWVTGDKIDEVVYDQSSFIVFGKPLRDFNGHYGKDASCQALEVIGNKFNHPHLLNKER